MAQMVDPPHFWRDFGVKGRNKVQTALYDVDRNLSAGTRLIFKVRKNTEKLPFIML